MKESFNFAVVRVGCTSLLTRPLLVRDLQQNFLLGPMHGRPRPKLGAAEDPAKTKKKQKKVSLLSR